MIKIGGQRMNNNYLRCQIENKVAVVTIDHSPGNLLNTQVYQEMTQLMGELEANEQVHVIILTGEGEESFVSGADINELAAFDAVEMMDSTQITRTSFSTRSEEHTSELQSRGHLVCSLLLDKKKAYS